MAADERYRSIRVKAETWERLKQQASEGGMSLAGWLTHLSLQIGGTTPLDENCRQIVAKLSPNSDDCRQIVANSSTNPQSSDLQAILDDFDSSDDWD